MNIDKIRYIAIKETIKTRKDGTKAKKESKYIFQFRVNGEWRLAREIDEKIDEQNGPEMHEKLRPFMDVFGKRDAAIMFPAAFSAIGEETPPAVKIRAEEAAKEKADMLKRREERERATIDKGRVKFMRKNAASGAARWERLLEKYGLDDDDGGAE